MTTPITGQGLNVCIPPDDELSLTSKKAAQNKVITEELTDLSNAISQLVTRLKSGAEEDAELHLGFYLDENGDLCQVEEDENNG